VQLSSETAPERWRRLVCCWLLVLGILGMHNVAVQRYLAISGGMGLRGIQEPKTPLQQTSLSFATDAQTWIRHAIALGEGDQVRLRHTDIDNAPEGRDVHWSSAWAWVIAAAGLLRRACTGDPLPLAVERAAIWLNMAVLSLCIVVFSSWVARRAGALSGIVVALGMAGSDRFYEGFYPAYVDHHGLLTAAAFGVMLGAVFMGVGWWQGEDDGHSVLPRSQGAVRSAALFSAVCGGCGMAVSAASTIPAIVIVGTMGLVASLLCWPTMRQGTARFDATAWRLWGRIGGAISLLFYLLEYFPNDVGMRLEVNHPLYALAWACGGEVIAQTVERCMATREQRWSHPASLLGAVLGVLAAPLVIGIGGPRVFAMSDPFMATLHGQIGEFQSPIRSVGGIRVGFLKSLIDPIWAAVAVGIGLLCRRRGRGNVVLWFTTLATLLFLALGLWQQRWLMSGSGPHVCMLLVVLAVGLAGRSAAMRWGVVLAVCGMTLVLPMIARVTSMTRRVTTRTVAPKDAMQPLFRDIAAAVRESQPEGDVVLLSSPLGSTGVGYYGRFKTTGTLYWENTDGLKTAASIFSAPSTEKAAALVKAHGITHIAMIADENFVAAYFQLLHPQSPQEAVKECFGYRLGVAGRLPSWLRMLPYRPPPDVAGVVGVAGDVRLYQVNFDQTPAEATLHLAIAQRAAGDVAAALQTLDVAAHMAPDAPDALLCKGEVLFQGGRWGEAAEAWQEGITRAPVSQRGELYASAGNSFADCRAYALAVKMYRLSLDEKDDAEVMRRLEQTSARIEDPGDLSGGEQNPVP